MLNKKLVKVVGVVLIAVVLAGCAAQKAYRHAEKDAKRENWDAAVLGYIKALALDPGNTRYSVALERAKLKSSAQHFDRGTGNYTYQATAEDPNPSDTLVYSLTSDAPGISEVAKSTARSPANNDFVTSSSFSSSTLFVV